MNMYFIVVVLTMLWLVLFAVALYIAALLQSSKGSD